MKKSIHFFSDGLKLEGVLYAPDERPNLAVVIVLHPMPQYGGSMDNNVVDAVCEELSTWMGAMKFNCRGVGRSEGVSTGGREEGRDVQAAIQFLKKHELFNQNRIGFVGYSWGTYVGLPVTFNNPDVKVLVGISCPVGMWNFNYLKACQKPLLLTVGKRDQFAPLAKVKILFETLAHPKDLVLFETDHFYIGHERELAIHVSKFLKKYI
ncbi:MAG: alpha/beta hydrolase [Candidatus Helarchaeota archaeon]